jgi:hypothetical protein
MSARRLLSAMAALAVAVSFAILLSGHLTSQAVQNPTISLDMVTTGTTYDDTTNTMSVGTIDPASSSGINVTHVHATHLVIQNVEDLVGWQVRLNYVGDRMRPLGQNVTPFTDNTTAQNVGFTNLPIDQATFVHRDMTPLASIPAAPPDGTNTAQTALLGGVYQGTQAFPVSPDTPAKAVPDDSSYSAPTGGVVSQLNLQVIGNECNTGQMMMDLDDNSPNPPGSTAIVFNGAGTTTMNLGESALSDGFHEESGGACGSPPPTTAPPTPSPCATPGPTAPPVFINDETFPNQLAQSASDLHSRYNGPVGACLLQNAPGCPAPVITHVSGGFDVDWGTACVDNGESVTVRVTSEPPSSRICSDWTLSGTVIGPAVPPSCTSTPTPPPSATPTPTPNPAGHDARLTRISGVPKNVRLLPGEVINDSASIVVANQSSHTETIGVYVDVTAPSGCTPNARVFSMGVTLAAGAKTTVSVPVSYGCSDPAAANGLSYAWVAVADHAGDDIASCGPRALQSVACFNALADDDQDPADNRASRNGPKVVAQ